MTRHRIERPTPILSDEDAETAARRLDELAADGWTLVGADAGCLYFRKDSPDESNEAGDGREPAAKKDDDGKEEEGTTRPFLHRGAEDEEALMREWAAMCGEEEGTTRPFLHRGAEDEEALMREWAAMCGEDEGPGDTPLRAAVRRGNTGKPKGGHVPIPTETAEERDERFRARKNGRPDGQEPSMEDILASIRRILSEDEEEETENDRSAPLPKAIELPPPMDESRGEPSMDDILGSIRRILSKDEEDDREAEAKRKLAAEPKDEAEWKASAKDILSSAGGILRKIMEQGRPAPRENPAPAATPFAWDSLPVLGKDGRNDEDESRR
jgi:cell pole-organizing protein PopZ